MASTTIPLQRGSITVGLRHWLRHLSSCADSVLIDAVIKLLEAPTVLPQEESCLDCGRTRRCAHVERELQTEKMTC
jgi:hypothetical protein